MNRHSLDVIKRVRDLWSKGKTSDALNYLVSKIPKDCFTEELLVYTACLMQISDRDVYELKNVEKILKLACDFYPNSAEVHYELGMFYDVVMDDPQNGLKHLDIAKELLQKRLEDVEQGIRECTGFDVERDFHWGEARNDLRSKERF